MIYLNYGDNNIVVTLTETTIEYTITGVTSTLCLQLVNELTKDEILFDNLIDLSFNVARYNEYLINVSSNIPSGYYIYNFYKRYNGGFISNSLEIGRCLINIPENNNIIATETVKTIVAREN